jgi:hypothetical protein
MTVARFPVGVEFLLLATASRVFVGPTQPPIHWVPGVKRPGCKIDRLLQSSADVKNEWSHASTRPYFFMAWYLIRQ